MGPEVGHKLGASVRVDLFRQPSSGEHSIHEQLAGLLGCYSLLTWQQEHLSGEVIYDCHDVVLPLLGLGERATEIYG